MSDQTADCKIVRASDVSPQQWRNGGGETRELLVITEGADWRLRISLAKIEKNGPFSSFPGVQRWFAVVGGEGVCLRFSNAERHVTRDSAPISFDGGDPPDCALIDGPTQDLNLMTRGGSAIISTAQANCPWAENFARRGFFASSPGNFYFGVFGANADSARRSDDQPFRLEAFSLLWDFGARECWFEPDHAGNAGFWLGYSS